MKTFFKCTMAAGSVVLCFGLIVAWSRMHQGEPWRPANRARKGVISIAYGTSARSIELAVNGDGLRVDRNPSETSFERVDVKPAWTYTYLERPIWHWCGNDKDSYQLSSTWSKAGIRWKAGTWNGFTLPSGEDDVFGGIRSISARPNFSLRLPHWLLVTLTALVPMRIATGVIRRRVRLREGCCSSCGYDLTGNASGVCPECGTGVVATSAGNVSTAGISAEGPENAQPYGDELRADMMRRA